MKVKTNHMTTRPAKLDDCEIIARFNQLMAKETEDVDLSWTRLLSGVKRFIDQPNYGFYLLAECEGEIVGQLGITYEWSDWRDGVFWWIQSVFVAPRFRRHGVFRTLYQTIHDRAQADSDVCGLRLYMEKENKSAQKVYENLGMEMTHYRMLEVDFSQG